MRGMLLIAVGVAWGGSALVTPASIEAQSDGDDVRAAQAERFAAMIEADVDMLASLLAAELVYTHTTATVETKSEFLASVGSGEISYESIRPHDVEVRVYDEAAVAAGRSDMRVRVDGRVLEFTIRFLETYVRREGRWQLTAWQSTRLPS